MGKMATRILIQIVLMLCILGCAALKQMDGPIYQDCNYMEHS